MPKGRAAAQRFNARSPRATRVTFAFGTISEQTTNRKNTAPTFFFKKPGTNFFVRSFFHKKTGGRRPISNKIRKTEKKSGLEIYRDSSPTPVTRGGSGAKAPPLAARPKSYCWLGSCG